jgi:hypothetical protein
MDGTFVAVDFDVGAWDHGDQHSGGPADLRDVGRRVEHRSRAEPYRFALGAVISRGRSR